MAASRQAIIIMIRRSIRSESRPIGHCPAAPASAPTAIKTAALSAPSPLTAAKTGPRVQNAPLERPTLNDPTNPTGDIRYSLNILNLTRFGATGSCERVRDNGTAASDTRIEASANKENASGSSIVIKS